MTFSHKKEFMSLFLNIALVSSQIVQLTAQNIILLREVCYCEFLNNALRTKSVLRLRYLCL
jgi:hypothetical protein